MSAPGDFELCQRVDLCEINNYFTWYHEVQWTINYDLNTKWMQKYTFLVLEIDFTWLVVQRSCFYSAFVNSLQSTNLTTHSMNSTSIIFAISGPRSQFPRPTATWSRRRSLEYIPHLYPSWRYSFFFVMSSVLHVLLWNFHHSISSSIYPIILPLTLHYDTTSSSVCI